MTRFAAALVVAYLLGSIPTAYLLVRSLRRADIRTLGSGNVGATNAGRILGRWGFVATLAGDIAKGAAAVLLANWIGETAWAAWLAVPAVVVGHVWPVTLGMRGGKGVGVGIGALAVADVRLCAIGVLLFGVLFATTRRYQLSGLTSIVAVPLIAILLQPAGAALSGVAATVIIVLVAHREDIREALSPSVEG